MPHLNPIATPRDQLHAEEARRNREAAVNAILGEKVEIDEMPARLQVHSDDHFSGHPEDINWTHVGTLEHYVSLQECITDSAFREVEHAR